MRRISVSRAEMARIAVLAAVIVVGAVALGGIALAVAPAALLALLLWHEVFVGEELIARRRDRLGTAVKRAPDAAPAGRRHQTQSLQRLLLAMSLASRGPPLDSLLIRVA